MPNKIRVQVELELTIDGYAKDDDTQIISDLRYNGLNENVMDASDREMRMAVRRISIVKVMWKEGEG